MPYSFRVLYITINENIGSASEGVSKKLLSKVSAIQKLCSDCILLNASADPAHNEIKLIERTGQFINIQIGVKDANTGYLNKIKMDGLFYTQLASYIRNNNLNFDRFIFRYPYATNGLNYFTQQFTKKIVFEHNSKEIEELNIIVANKNYADFNLIPSKFFYWYQEKRYPIYAEKNFSRQVMKNACAGSCVTTEIAEYEKQRNPGYRTFVSSNFYDVSGVSLSTSTYSQDQLLSLGMIVTATSSWYGLERLLRSFAPVQKKYKLTIAGIGQNDTRITKLLSENNIKENIHFLGKLNKDQLVSFYNSVHVCFGSLGLYTINLNYASTLKVKESLAFGVPVAVGYQEEDFIHQKDFLPYYIQLSNDNSLVDFEAIKKFAVKFYSDPVNKMTLRDLALKHLDVNVKIRALLENIKPS